MWSDDERNWLNVFSVEAYSGIHIYNFFKDGNTSAAVPGAIVYTNRTFRHPLISDKMKQSQYVRFSVFKHDLSEVAKRVIFQIKPNDGLENWFSFERLEMSMGWNFSSRGPQGIRGSWMLISASADQDGTDTRLQRYFHMSHSYAGCPCMSFKHHSIFHYELKNVERMVTFERYPKKVLEKSLETFFCSMKHYNSLTSATLALVFDCQTQKKR